jgi:hypothetical protein
VCGPSLRALLLALLLLEPLATACGGRAASAGPNADAGGSESSTTIASGPPLSIPGVSVWLDGDVGIGIGAAGIERWADRSGQGHVFVGHNLAYGPADVAVRPQPGRLGGHGAVRFNARNRMIIEEFPTPEQQAGLTFGLGGFLIAVGFRPRAQARRGGRQLC